VTKAAVGLGSNLGDRLGYLRRALDALKRLSPLIAVSSLYETAPVGGPEQGPYLNAVAVIETDLGPEDLMAALLTIERMEGRLRRERFGPRTIDLDLIVYENASVSTDKLILPHPRADERRFVVEPLAEIWPDARLRSGRAADLVAHVRNQKARRLARAWVGDRLEFAGSGRGWVSAQIALLVGWGVLLAGFGRFPAGWSWLGAAPATLGAGLVAWASGQLGSNLSIFPRPVARAPLAQGGPYRLARHPIYGGVILVLIGLGALFRSLPALVLGAAMSGFFLAKASEEERYLRLAYPEYEDYTRRVPHRLLPLPFL
jgi:2-amino-4-hydroxy-6-hydroxymethyldihydropteridine diphosphokinase